nr:NB-ARC domains-containing protein [Tanacetum cinerariifolium]
MNQNNEDRQSSVFEIDANDDETDVVFLEQAYAYHQQLVDEENRLPLTRNLINRDREGAEGRLMADYFNDHCEDYNIPLERLTHYWVGLAAFKYLDSMEDARNEVRHAVKILKSTCLLLDGKDELTLKMHDVVREVALLIASEGSNKFLVKAGIYFTEWRPRTKGWDILYTIRTKTGIMSVLWR